MYLQWLLGKIFKQAVKMGKESSSGLKGVIKDRTNCVTIAIG